MPKSSDSGSKGKAATKKTIVKRPPRTPKEKAFAKEYIANGGNATKAALKAFDVNNGNTARSLASQTLAKLNIAEYFDKVEGLRLQDRLMKLVEGLNATKQISGISDANSGSVEFVEVPDYTNRYKYLELTFKLDGSLNKTEEPSGNVSFNQFILNQKNEYNGEQ